MSNVKSVVKGVVGSVVGNIYGNEETDSILMFDSRTGANGEKVFEVFDTETGEVISWQAVMLYDQNYGVADTIETQTAVPINVCTYNRSDTTSVAVSAYATASAAYVRAELYNNDNLNATLWCSLGAR